MNRLSRGIFVLVCALGLAGCACCPEKTAAASSVATPAIPPGLIEKALKNNPLLATENMKVTLLGSNDKNSCSLVQIRSRERMHTHKDHDLRVVLWKGTGTLILNGKSLSLKEGDQADIPKNQPHSFTNTSGEPAIAVVWFTPAFDGKDTQYLE